MIASVGKMVASSCRASWPVQLTRQLFGSGLHVDFLGQTSCISTLQLGFSRFFANTADGAETCSGIRSEKFHGFKVEPVNEHRNSFIWLHGMGETAAHWMDVAQDVFGPALPHTRLILPTAPLRDITRLQGVSLPAWMDSEGHADRFDERCAGLIDSCALVEKLIEDEIEDGIATQRIIIGGFSQGAALALHVALRTLHPLGGVLGINGYLPGVHRQPMLVQRRLHVPLLCIHGSNDNIVHIEDGWRAFRALYTGSLVESDTAASAQLRQMWTFDSGSRRGSTGLLDQYHSDSDDEDFDLRSRMSIPVEGNAGIQAIGGLQGPACRLMPGGEGGDDSGGNLSSFVTFPGVGHSVTDDMLQTCVDWINAVLGPDPCRHPPRKRRTAPSWYQEYL